MKLRAFRTVLVLSVLAGVIGCDGCQKKARPPSGAPIVIRPPVVDAGPAVPAGEGTIEGEVTLVGEAPQMQPLKRGADPVCAKTPMNDETVLATNGKLANVVVRLAGPISAAGSPGAAAIVDQVDCMYRPRVQAVQSGQSVEIRNSDKTLHNVHIFNGTKTVANNAQPPNAPPIVKTFSDGTALIKLKCDVHPWMTGYIFLVDHPYFATTGQDGRFSIKGIPAGMYTLEAWHERFGTKLASATVKADGTTEVSFSFAPGDRG